MELCAIGVELETTLGFEGSVHTPFYELRAPTKAYEATRQGEPNRTEAGEPGGVNCTAPTCSVNWKSMSITVAS